MIKSRKLYYLFYINNYRVLFEKIKQSMDTELPQIKKIYEGNMEARKNSKTKEEKDTENHNT